MGPSWQKSVWPIQFLLKSCVRNLNKNVIIVKGLTVQTILVWSDGGNQKSNLILCVLLYPGHNPAPKKSNTKPNFLFLIIFLSRWRGRNHLSYLRAKSHYDSQPGEASEHPLIYDDANIQFYRGNNAYLLEPGNRQRCPASMSAIGLLPQSASTGMVRDTSGLSQQVGLLLLHVRWVVHY